MRRANGTDKHRDVTKARLRETTTRAIAEGRIPAVSGLENKVAAILSEIGIGFQRQVGVRDPITGRFGACVDFLLDDGRVLEVNGTFWHADPRVYPETGLKPAQIRTLDRWAAKVALLSRLNITTLVLWELDFRKNPRQAVEIALAGVGK
jgi:G:T-mismatch repair DNA endonuclease (very short patch repair protein)